ncbi:MAG: isoleucine--tRNA ligase [Acidobacteriota bacterium]
MSTFKPVTSNVDFPALEREVLSIWKERRVFERSVEQRPESKAYSFYDGPPFATGLPHYGHFVASTLKDIVPRYWAMRGYRVERRFGWDTHGLPIEMEIEKKLGLSGPTSIREHGIAEFNEECRRNVLRYTEEWRVAIERLGRWVDFDDDYKTMDPSFMESVWWVFKRLWDEGLVYQGLKVVPYSWRLSTALSNFEANLDYRDVQDPALTVALKLDDDEHDASLLIWTTTPWTLPSNLGVAVGPEVEYVKARAESDGPVYVVAAARREAVLGEGSEVVASLTGQELLGRGYQPLFPYFERFKELPAGEGGAFRVLPSDEVSTEEGTGLVHMAPAFGEVDFAVCQAAGLEVVDPVDAEGRFTEEVSDFAGQNVKEADKAIIKMLKDRGAVFHHGTIVHSYPYCWRSGTPLIYKTVPSWFVKVTSFRSRMVELNETIHWVPEAVGSKRFGNWLADGPDWNISRDRFWGTPLPVWECDSCDERECFGSIADLEERSGEKIDDLHPHLIDGTTFPCANCGGDARRVAPVFDCWFESGSMPYGQSHYPFENKEDFEARFPAEYIAEGLDQTRGWFYSLLVLSTALFDRVPFKNCVVNGMVLAEDGSKMSKSKKNYPDPMIVLDDLGADALRAFLINSPIVRAEPLRFSEAGVKDVVRTVLLPLRNAWSFFVQYANVDGWHPEKGLDGQPTPAVADRPEIDRWILSVLQSLVREVNEQMEGYYLYKVVPPMVGFIDHLTNWYIRRSRRRFWRSAEGDALADKAAAYATLYEVLVTFGKVMAPVLPFVTDALYQNLVVEPGCQDDELDSVHLCDYPQADESRIDHQLEKEVALTRQVVGMGRALRKSHELKVRQPLARVVIVHHDAEALAIVERHAEQLVEELNVKEVITKSDDDDLCTLSFKANFRRLGPRFGKQMKAIAQVVTGLDAEQFATLRDGGTVPVDGGEIELDDVLVERAPRGGVVIEAEGPLTVALDTQLDDALRMEGTCREVVSRLQRLRKDGGLEITDRVAVVLGSSDEALRTAMKTHREYIADEVLATSLEIGESASGESLDIDGRPLEVELKKA